MSQLPGPRVGQNCSPSLGVLEAPTGWSPTAHSSDLIIFTSVFLLTPAVLPHPLHLLPGVSSSIIFALKFLAQSLFLMEPNLSQCFGRWGEIRSCRQILHGFHEHEGKRGGFKSNLESTICRNYSFAGCIVRRREGVSGDSWFGLVNWGTLLSKIRTTGWKIEFLVTYKEFGFDYVEFEELPQTV